MGKKILEKILGDKDLKESALNFALTLGAGYTLNIISNKFFGFNLDRYNTIMHLAIGVGAGTMAYRKAGGGLRGVVAGLAAATGFNLFWEPTEYFGNIYGNVKPSTMDMISDIGSVYVGSLLGFGIEKLKERGNGKEK